MIAVGPRPPHPTGALATPRLEARVRNPMLDIARGAAIVLVVWGHGIIGVQRALGSDEAGRFAILLIYSVHMPLFFFVSGLLTRAALAEPAALFSRRLAVRIAYPYFLWSTVLLVAHFLMSDLTNTELRHLDLASLLHRPPAVMWFLYVLFFCLLLARGLRSLSAAAGVAIGSALVVVGYLVDGWMLPHLRFVGIFLIATRLDQARVLEAMHDRRLVICAAVAVAIAGLIAFRAAGAHFDGFPARDLRYLPAAVGGVVLILAAAGALARRGPIWTAWLLAYIGRRTMPIFVTHILVVAAVRIALVGLGVGNAVLIVAVATGSGVLLPLAASRVAERWSLARPLGWAA